MRTLLFFLFCGAVTGATHAQVPGYLGKHVVLKTDAMSYLREGGYSAQAELALFRRSSLQIGYHTQSKEYDQYVLDPSSSSDSYTSDAALLDSWEFRLAVKSYHSRAVPAPKGWYNYLQLTAGQAEIRGHYLEETSGTGMFAEYDFQINNVQYRAYEGGFGVQTFLGRLVALDLAMGINYSVLDAGEDDNRLIEEMRYRHGSNLWVIAPNNRLVGFAAHIGVGIILF